MTKTVLYTLLLIIFTSSVRTIDKSLLNKKQTQLLFDMMISDIEYYDAEMRATRNNSKEVSWEEYKAFHKKKWNKSISPKELKQLFYEFRRGYLNGHSHLSYLHPVEKTNKIYSDYESTIKLRYTYPNISFYNEENGNKIISINNKPIEDVFWNFSNYRTSKIRPNAVLNTFSANFNQRYLKIDGEFPFTIQYEDQKTDSVIYKSVELSDEDIFFDGIDVSDYADWETIEKGYKVALLKKNDVALIKIKNFIYMNGVGGDVECDDPVENSADSTMCKDVKLLMRGLKSMKEKTNYLIFD